MLRNKHSIHATFHHYQYRHQPILSNHIIIANSAHVADYKVLAGAWHGLTSAFFFMY